MIDDKSNLTRIVLIGLILASGAFATKYLAKRLFSGPISSSHATSLKKDPTAEK
jgi:hypothetical protein